MHIIARLWRDHIKYDNKKTTTFLRIESTPHMKVQKVHPTEGEIVALSTNSPIN